MMKCYHLSLLLLISVPLFLIAPTVTFAQRRADTLKKVTIKKVIPKKDSLLYQKLNLKEVAVSDSRELTLNTIDAANSWHLSTREIEALPIEARDVTKTLYRLPNLTLSTLGYAEGPTVAINGLSGIYTNYLIDGMDNNERFLGNVKFNPPSGFVKSVNVFTSNYSAEFGNTSSGIIDYETRSGTNDFKGELFYLTRPGSVIDSKSSFASLDLSGNQVKDGFKRNQFGTSFGGALVKDKTFFYVDLEHIKDQKDNLLNSPALGVNETVRGFNNFTFLSAKLDQYWGKVHSSLRANVGLFDIGRQGGGLEGGVNFPSSGATEANRTYLIASKNAYVINSKLKAETNFQTSYFRWNYYKQSNPTSPTVIVLDSLARPAANLGFSGYVYDDKEYTQQFQQKFTYTIPRHTFKFGGEFTTSSFSLLGGGNPNGVYTVALSPAQQFNLKSKNLGSALSINDIPADVRLYTDYQVELNTTTFGARQNVFNGYLEDHWAPSKRLGVSAGLRYDYDNLSKAGGTKGDRFNFGPRAGLNYQLTDNDVLKAGYGLHYDKIKYSIYSDNIQTSSNSSDFKKELTELQRLGILNKNADLNRITFPGNLPAVIPNVSYLQGPKSSEIQTRRETQFANAYKIQNPDGYKNPYSHQFTLGYQRKMSGGRLFSVDGLWTRTFKLPVIVDLNSPSYYPIDPKNIVPRKVDNANLTRPIPVVSTGSNRYAVVGGDTLRGISRDVLETQTIGRAQYYGITLALQQVRTDDNPFAYRISYTLSQVKNTGESINTRAQDANDFNREYALGDNDRTHVITGYLSWFPARGLSITPSYLYQSGQPITRLLDVKNTQSANGTPLTTDLNGKGQSFTNPADRQPGESRNSDRLPASTTIDLSVKYAISIRNKPTLEFSADIFNLLNAENLSGYNVVRGASNQNQYGPKSDQMLKKVSSAPPRQFQFGVRYLW